MSLVDCMGPAHTLLTLHLLSTWLCCKDSTTLGMLFTLLACTLRPVYSLLARLVLREHMHYPVATATERLEAQQTQPAICARLVVHARMAL